MDVTLENGTLRYVIAADGRNLHFVEKATGADHIVPEPPSRCAHVTVGGDRHEASAVAYADGRLTLAFGASGVTAVVRVAVEPSTFVFEVESLSGHADELVFVNVPTTLRVVADEPFSAGALALNLQTNVEELPGPQQHLWAACYRRFGFAGAQAGLVACPYSEMREALKQMVDGAPGVPHSPLGGPWAMDSDLPGGSYLFGSPTEETVDSWIELCHALGFTQIDFCGCLNYGDYQPFPKLYADGYRSVKAVTDRLHEAGILAGLHTMSFSISKQCDWVTPVPDRRLAKERSYTLAAAVGPEDAVIPLAESTEDLPKHVSYYVRRSMTVRIDDELIEYALVNDTAPYAVAGCKRGALGTVAAPHAKGAEAHHLKQCWGCFAPDGDSTLFSDVAKRIATVINECGFDFTYLDGLDGAHIIGGEENRWHYGTKFAFEVYRHLDRPIMMEMATFHHHLWFVRSRMQAWDHTVRGHKTFIDLHCASNEGCRRIFMPRHLGWSRVLAWQGAQHEATFDDDVEYMWCKGLGTDSGYSLQSVTPQMYAAEPWMQEVAPIIKRYETLRRDKVFPESVKAKLREPGAEFTLERAADGQWQFQPRQYVRHKVEGLEGPTNRWQVSNRFAGQPLRLRIEALMSAGPYDAVDNPVLADFGAPGELSDCGTTQVILNSGKLYSYPSAAPGLSAEILPSSDVVKAAGTSGCWTAISAGSAGRVPCSAPDDEFSLLDHAERAYRPQEASWVRLGKVFSPPLDLGERHALGVWIHGDGQGELISMRLGSPGDWDTTDMDHYVVVDFTGWRYFELIEPEAGEFEKYSWPYGRSLYKQYRELLHFNCIGRLELWYNNVPRGGTVTCHLSPIKALPLLKNMITRPAITVGGQTVVFPVDIESGCYLEYNGPDDCTLFGPKREKLADVRPEGGAPVLEPGTNDVAFGCSVSDLRPRADVTVITHGDTPLRG